MSAPQKRILRSKIKTTYFRNPKFIAPLIKKSFLPPLDKVGFRDILIDNSCRSGGMADAMDSKSIVRKVVWVRLPPPVSKAFAVICKGFFSFRNFLVLTA